MSSLEVRAVAIAGVVALAACGHVDRRDVVALRGGSANRGKLAIARYGCNTCHAISGFPDPTVLVAGPVTGIARRAYIAGTLPTTRRNLVMWIRFPHQVKPQTAMPDLGVSAGEARDIAAYLYSLR
ncbi:MAG TPA: hypothetical protein VII66_06625 [Gemmatimonadaceae bacterium]